MEVDKLTAARTITKESAVAITQERLALGHPEDVCKNDMQDWLYILEKCKSVEEVSEKFSEWTVRAEAYQARLMGRIH